MSRSKFVSSKALFVGLTVGVFLLGVQLVSWAEGLPCVVPNPTSMACYTPEEEHIICDSANQQNDCEGAVEYVIGSFPDGTSESATGKTKEKQTTCWSKASCKWYGALNPPRCGQDTMGPIHPLPKTVVDDSTPKCPAAGG